MAERRRWCRVTVLGPDGTVLARRVLAGAGRPGLAAVDRVARLALLAGRIGGSIALTEVAPALAELLALAGLPVEVEGQAELGEEPFGVE
jgi:hypothetical protein